MTKASKAQAVFAAANIKSELDFLKGIQDKKEGNRSLSVAITNLETALLWLVKATEEDAE